MFKKPRCKRSCHCAAIRKAISLGSDENFPSIEKFLDFRSRERELDERFQLTVWNVPKSFFSNDRKDFSRDRKLVRSQEDLENRTVAGSDSEFSSNEAK